MAKAFQAATPGSLQGSKVQNSDAFCMDQLPALQSVGTDDTCMYAYTYLSESAKAYSAG